MAELLSWAVPITLVTFCIAGAFSILGATEIGPDEFWIARGCFLAAGLFAIARIILWGFTTPHSLPVRLIVGGLIIGVSGVLSVEAVRYVNRKHLRWLEAQKPTPAPAPALIDSSTKDTKESITGSPNLVDRGVRVFRAHQDIWSQVLVEGASDRRYSTFDPDWQVLTIEICNEFRVIPKTIPVDSLTAEMKYTFPDDSDFKMNRGAWLGARNRIALGVNDARDLIIVLAQISHSPHAQLFIREYPRSEFIHLDSIIGDLQHGQDYGVEIELISESKGEHYGTLNYMLAVSKDGAVEFVKASDWETFQDARAETANQEQNETGEDLI